MNHQFTSRAIFLAGMVIASGAFAGNDINKCIAPTGSVTLTDEPCPDGTRTIKVVSGPADEIGDAEALDSAARPSVERYTMQRMPTRYTTRMRSAQPSRGLSLDVSTLKAARLNMHLIDNAAQALKSQSVAGL